MFSEPRLFTKNQSAEGTQIPSENRTKPFTRFTCVASIVHEEKKADANDLLMDVEYDPTHANSMHGFF